MDNCYLEVARHIEAYMANWRFTPNQQANLHSNLATQPWHINFDTVSIIYNKIYWTRNFWKTAYFFNYDYTLSPAILNRLSSTQTIDVLVLGSGAGSDTLALITWINANYPLIKVRITVIDRSQKQLDVLKAFLRACREDWENVEVDIRYIHIDGDQWYPTINSADLIIIGHFL